MHSIQSLVQQHGKTFVSSLAWSPAAQLQQQRMLSDSLDSACSMVSKTLWTIVNKTMFTPQHKHSHNKHCVNTIALQLGCRPNGKASVSDQDHQPVDKSLAEPIMTAGRKRKEATHHHVQSIWVIIVRP